MRPVALDVPRTALAPVHAAPPCSPFARLVDLVGALARRVAVGAVPGGAELVGNLRP